MVEERTVNDSLAGSRAGARFGHYQLRWLLGAGAFGEVYEAEDTVMQRVVALKLMAPPYSQNPVFRERLYREAHTAGRLREPHVVPIHQCGEIDGQLYIDMRFIEGTDLHRVLMREGPLCPERAVEIVRQIAAALDAAHADQMIHRDVKPANILLGADDFACLVDFGLAAAATDARLTSAGSTIGTFTYMSPERLSNAEVSHRADIYALACVLYQCLTGSPPYATEDLPALVTMHLTAPIPRPSQHRPQIPVGFDDVIARGMAKNPDDRWGSAGELAAAAQQALSALDQDHTETVVVNTPAQTVLSHSPATAPTPPPNPVTAPRKPASRSSFWRRRGVVITLAALVLSAVAVTVTVVVGHRSPPRAASPSSSAQAVVNLPGPQVELPFTGLKDPYGVAVDTAGTVYVTDVGGGSRAFKLPAGSDTAAMLPFTGLNLPWGVAVDSGGNVYVTDFGNNRVLKLPAGSDTPAALPFTGLNLPSGVAVDNIGNVYVADYSNNRVLKLPAGSSTAVALPFTGLNLPSGVAVDRSGNVYVTDFGNSRVLKLPAGANTAATLPFTGLNLPRGVAVDNTGNVYVADYSNNRVLKLPAGSNTPATVPFTGLNLPWGVAVDTDGNIYVADDNRVIKIPAG
ncbi:MAG: protein kinase [Mycobacteriaceae bacterium]|nr:protein kinase [Mycobacteriaceae bacterium]